MVKPRDPWRHGGLALLLLLALVSARGAPAAPGVEPESHAGHAHDESKRERDILLDFSEGITNWAEVQASWGLAGWANCTSADCAPVCTWSNVECDASGAVTELHLGCTGCSVRLQGTLRPGLQELRHLAVLHLSDNELQGPLPPEWGRAGGFESLLDLDASHNRLDSLPDAWSAAGAFPRLLSLQLSHNRLRGGVPRALAAPANASSFAALLALHLNSNNLTGALPPSIALPSLTLLALQDNALAGPLPPGWAAQGPAAAGGAARRSLQQLLLHGNRLTGGLPDAWSQPGSLASLRELSLGSNPLGGSLPPAWGAAGAFPELHALNLSAAGLTGSLPEWGAGLQSLEELLLDGNDLAGSIPAAWQGLPQLQYVVVQPGNTAMCAEVPAGAEFSLCQAGPDGSPTNCTAQEPTSREQCSSSSSSSGGSSFPVAAVAAPLAVVGAAALAAVGYTGWRRRRRAISTASGPDPEEGTSKGASAVVGRTSASVGDSGLLHSGSTTAAGGPPGPDGGLSGQSGGSQLPRMPSSGSSLPGGPRSGGSEAPNFSELEAAALALSDWMIPPEEITIAKRPDGSDWQLGSGGFGTVYKAMRNGVQPVAVKVLGSIQGEPLKPMSDCDFAKEITILRACRDTNILQFQGACFKEGRTLLVTEYMEGGNLMHNIRARKVTWWRRGKRIALDVARALVYLHARKIVHLDIKSANVLLTREGVAKVGDVGMAKIMAGDYVTGVVGTLAWSAPEMLWGHHCGTKADVYSLGVVLWEIATGEGPVRGRLRDPLVPEECPAELVAIINRCLDADPERRPSASELVDLLKDVPGAASSSSAAPSAAASAATLPAMASPFGGSGSVSGSRAAGGSPRGSAAASRAGSCESSEAGAAQAAGRAGSAAAMPPARSLGSVQEHEAVAEAAAELRAAPATPAQPTPPAAAAGGKGGRLADSQLALDPAASLTTFSPFSRTQR